MARPLDASGNVALMSRAQARLVAVADFSRPRDVIANRREVLKINLLNVFFAKIALHIQN